ncbi:unnamed protein product [Urochloa humidicola]
MVVPYAGDAEPRAAVPYAAAMPRVVVPYAGDAKLRAAVPYAAVVPLVAVPDGGDARPRANVPDAGDTAAAAQRAVSDSFVLDSIDEVPDSIYELPDSVDEVPDSMDEVPDSVEEVLDVDAVFDCPRCKTFHAGGVFGEACRQARCNARRCAHCGLLHEDYDGAAQILHGMEHFDCKFYIPVVEELQLDGDTIILPEQVVQKLDEMDAARKNAKANREGAASQVEGSKEDTTYGFGKQ